MDSEKIIPELHDVGKLVDSKWMVNYISEKLSIPAEKLDFSHSFWCINKETGEEIDYLSLFKESFKEIPSYECIRYHHAPNKKEASEKVLSEFISKRNEYHIFLTSLADQMASNVSRAVSNEEANNLGIKGLKAERKFIKLWKVSSYNVTNLISSEEEFNGLIKFINSVTNKDHYLNCFEKELLNRPEDLSPPKNITSLYTHSKLVGKIFRFFDESKAIKKEKNHFEFQGIKANSLTDAMNKWSIVFILGQIKFPHYPSRVKDLNLFQILMDIIKNFSQNNNVIFNTSTRFMALLLPNTDLEEFCKPFTDSGFIVKIEKVNVKLNQLHLTPRSLKNRKLIEPRIIQKNYLDRLNNKCFSEDIFSEYNIYGNLSPTIDSLCEICQMKPAKRDWVDEDNGIVEHLCSGCYSIREKESLATLIQDWYGKNPHSKIAWIKIDLDINYLNEVLENLLNKYLEKTLKSKDFKDLELRFSVLAEFQNDYNSFLKDFKKSLIDEFGNDNIQLILDDFFCVNIDKLSKLKTVLQIYYELFYKYFPKLAEQKSPITFSASASSAKFAFFRHWQLIDQPLNDVNIIVIGKGSMHVSLQQLGELLKSKIYSTTQLHKLAKVSEKSELLGKILVYDRGDFRVYSDLEPVRRLNRVVNFNTILIFAKIMEEGDFDEIP
jgi:hypothetical protein